MRQKVGRKRVWHEYESFDPYTYGLSTFYLTHSTLWLASLQAGLVDADGHLVGESDGQSFGLGVLPFSKPGKKPKFKKSVKEQVR